MLRKARQHPAPNATVGSGHGHGRTMWPVARLRPLLASQRSGARYAADAQAQERKNAVEEEKWVRKGYLPVLLTCGASWQYGEAIGVVGSHPALDNWSQGKVSNVLEFGDPREYGFRGMPGHIGWMYLPEGEVVEFKFVRVDECDHTFKAWCNDVNDGKNIVLKVEDENFLEVQLGTTAAVVGELAREVMTT